MARDQSPIVKQSRREGYALHPKAVKIMARKTGIPGQHANDRRGKTSLYSQQLREKQKVRRIYGLLEKQFASLMKEAEHKDGLSGENLLKLLELRLDNVVYRAGFATSRRQARQLVTHGQFKLNGRRVDIPSIRVKIGDELVVREKAQKNGYFAHLEEVSRDTMTQPVAWIKADPKKQTIKIVALPTRENAEPDINEQLIVEYYSR